MDAKIELAVYEILSGASVATVCAGFSAAEQDAVIRHGVHMRQLLTATAEKLYQGADIVGTCDNFNTYDLFIVARILRNDFGAEDLADELDSLCTLCEHIEAQVA